MKRAIPFFLLFVLAATQAFAGWSQGGWRSKDTVMYSMGDSSSISADTVLGVADSEAEGTITPVDMVCHTISVQVDTAPSAGDTWKVYLQDDGTNTNVHATISDTDTDDISASTAVFIGAGSILTLNFDEIGTATATDGESASLLCDII